MKVLIRFLTSIQFALLSLFITPSLWATETNDELSTYVDSVQQAGDGMTLWQVLQSGGIIMIILGIFSVVLVSLTVYLFIHLNPEKLIPTDMANKMIQHVSKGQIEHALNLAKGRDSLISNIVIRAFSTKLPNKSHYRQSLEVAAKEETSTLWTSLGHLSDIAQVAPMLGLLGTVLGMIQAFNTIAFEAAVVKPVLLAGGVSKAMVTTAGGLSVAILAMVFNSFLKTRVQNITHLLEAFTSRMLEALDND